MCIEILRYIHTLSSISSNITTVASKRPLPQGDAVLAVSFDYDGGGLGEGGSVTLTINGSTAATGRVDMTVPFLFSMSGETLDVGVDTGSPVGPYPNNFRFTGDIHRIDVQLKPEQRDDDSEIAAGQLRGAVGTQ